MGEKVGGKGVAQTVGGNGFMNPCRASRLFDYLPEPETGHSFATIGDKQCVAAFSLQNQGTGRFHIGLNGLFCGDAKGDQAFFFPLSQNPEEAGRKVAAGDRQAYQL